MSAKNGISPNCNSRRKLQLLRSVILALAIISFIYFEIHSCSKDRVAAPAPPEEVPDNFICAATDVYFCDAQFGGVSGNIGTIMITLDGGRTWRSTMIPAGVLNDIQFIDHSRGWVAGKDGALYATADGGDSWERNAGTGYPPDEDFFRIQFFADNRGHILGYRGAYRTEDGGASWQNTWLAAEANRGALDMSFIDGETGYLLGGCYLETDPILLYRTIDGGLQWMPVEGSRSSVLSTVLTIWFVDAQTGWAGGGVIMKTEDGGTSWKSQMSAATVREFFFFDVHRGFAVGGKTILRTEDGGETWMDVTPTDDRIADLRAVYFIDAQNGWIVGRGTDMQAGDNLYKRSLLLVTADSGATWHVRSFLFDYTPFEGSIDLADE